MACNKECNTHQECPQTCHSNRCQGNGTFIIVIYILLVIILGSLIIR